MFMISEEYLKQLEDEYKYEEVPVEDFYENGRFICHLISEFRLSGVK